MKRPETLWKLSGGLLWHKENFGRLANTLVDTLGPIPELTCYCRCMTRVVVMHVQMYPRFLKPFEWPSSKELAHALLWPCIYVQDGHSMGRLWRRCARTFA